MKRVFRSCIDPLPRFLSTGGLVLVVSLVVSGTALSVYEYVQSARQPEPCWPRAAVRAADRTRPAGALRDCGGYATRAPCEVERVPAQPPCPSGAAESQRPATLFRPDAPTSGT